MNAYVSVWRGEITPIDDATLPDLPQLEFYSNESGTFDLTSTGLNNNFATCMQCVRVFADVDFDSNTFAKQFFQSNGTMVIDPSATPFSIGLNATITDLELVEVTIDSDTYTSTPVPNGACLIVNGPVQIDVPAPPPEWTCGTGYGDGVACDCVCGAWDPDCDNPDVTVENCLAGQTCVQPGVCDGVPAEWTCDPNEYDDGTECNCRCGLRDPDCVDDTLPIIGCPAGSICNFHFQCVPPEWTCNPDYVGDQYSCDCECGGWDPDCDDPTQDVYRCEEGQSCVQPGVCDGVPTAWTCDATQYGDGAECNCGCGTKDPDCDDDTLPIIGCAQDEVCSDSGVCEPAIPLEWTCDDAQYEDGTECNCGCGTKDPDCDDDTLPVVGCSSDSICNMHFHCVPPEWTCNPHHLGNQWGCDCNCGAWDPDCDDPSQKTYGCEEGQSCVQPGVCDGVPTAWTCDATQYDDGTECNCNCGTGDSDCSDDTLPIIGCAQGEVCTDSGVCELAVPLEWTCDDAQYEDGTQCNCGCGAKDPDCDDDTLPVVGCPTAGSICNMHFQCVPPEWTCNPHYLGDDWGCDCECGAWDPDCEDPTQNVANCSTGQVCVPPGVCQ
ncbi:MAG: hypothetical protein CSA75_02645 [Sorangium cellulosum]|nr:MAG: hypothetical protein CSA75_02645 [Sorangium cellulosum]